MSARTPLALALALATLALGSCRAVEPPAYAALETRAQVPVVYEAQIVGHAVRMNDLDLHGSIDAGEVEAGTPMVDVQARILDLEAAHASGAFGWVPHGKQALVVDRSAAAGLFERWIEEGVADDLSGPRLLAYAGRRATISIVNQRAYVESFKLAADDAVLIADPEVGVAEDGTILAIEPLAPAPDGSIELEVELNVAMLSRPIESTETNLPGLKQSVTLQLPQTLSQRLNTVVKLAPGDALVMGGLETEEPGRYLFVLLTADTVPGAGGEAR